MNKKLLSGLMSAVILVGSHTSLGAMSPMISKAKEIGSTILECCGVSDYIYGLSDLVSSYKQFYNQIRLIHDREKKADEIMAPVRKILEEKGYTDCYYTSSGTYIGENFVGVLDATKSDVQNLLALKNSEEIFSNEKYSVAGWISWLFHGIHMALSHDTHHWRSHWCGITEYRFRRLRQAINVALGEDKFSDANDHLTTHLADLVKLLQQPDLRIYQSGNWKNAVCLN